MIYTMQLDSGTVSFTDNRTEDVLYTWGFPSYTQETYITIDSSSPISIDMRTELKKISDNIEKVIFNEPATIILWKDKTKTVVKAQDGEPFDKEKGFLMALVKKLGQNKGNYNEVIKKWCGEHENN